MNRNVVRSLIGVVGIVLLGALAWYFGLFDSFLKPSQPVVEATIIPQVPAAPAPAAPATPAPSAAPAQPAASTDKTPAVVVPQFDVVRVEPSGDAVLAGTSAPKAHVEVLSGAQVVGDDNATAGGEWTVALGKPLSPGGHDISLRATSPGSDVAVLSDQRVAVSVPEGGKGDVLVVINQPGEPTKIVQVPKAVAPPAAAPAPQVAAAVPAPSSVPAPVPAQAPAPAPAPAQADVAAPAPPAMPSNAAPDMTPAAPAQAEASAPPASAPAGTTPGVTPAPGAQVMIGSVEIDNDKLFVGGVASSKGNVVGYLDDKEIADAQADPSGAFSLKAPAADVSIGPHKVRVDEVDDKGKVLARAEVPFDRVSEADVQVSASGTASGSIGAGDSGSASSKVVTLTIRRGDNLWNIARKIYGSGFRYVTIYQANNDQIRNPNLIYPGQVFLMPRSDDNWKKMPPKAGG